MKYKNVKYKTNIMEDDDVFYIGICDDEKETCAQLEEWCYKYGKKQNVDVEVFVWYTGESLCDDILNKKEYVDAIFLDIELISTDGIQVGNFIREELKNLETTIIYISSKSSYAMQLFQVQPLGFLIKPLELEEVEKILDKCIQLYEIRNQKFEYISRGIYYKIPYKEILYFYSQNKKINIITNVGEKQFNGKLKTIASLLPHNFIMIHQSYIINLDYMVEASYELVKMRGGILLNISQPYRKIVREQIMQCKWERK